MEYLFVMVAGGLCFVMVSWSLEVFVSRRQGALRFSSDERVANERAERLLAEFGEGGLPCMNRLQVWERIGWIWKSCRLVALRSGNWCVVPWLATMGVACLVVGAKTALLPDSHDLRVLLGVRDFISFLAAPPES